MDTIMAPTKKSTLGSNSLNVLIPFSLWRRRRMLVSAGCCCCRRHGPRRYDKGSSRRSSTGDLFDRDGDDMARRTGDGGGAGGSRAVDRCMPSWKRVETVRACCSTMATSSPSVLDEESDSRRRAGGRLCAIEMGF